MKQYFLMGAGVCLVLAVAGFFIWRVIGALISVYQDWQLGEELVQIERESKARRDARQQENARRLDNGCDHEVDDRFGSLPPGVCAKCGIEMEKPRGACDHIWKIGDGPVPWSYCQKCGKKYSSTASNLELLGASPEATSGSGGA